MPPSARASNAKCVAPPRGERGLKFLRPLGGFPRPAVAPPRGERGLKFREMPLALRPEQCRSPSWGAWIEMEREKEIIRRLGVAPPRGERGLKSHLHAVQRTAQGVAPPRGERGLKFVIGLKEWVTQGGRSPSWGAWIEIP